MVVTVAVAEMRRESRCAVFCCPVSSLSVDPFTVVQGLIADHNKITKTPDTGLRLLPSKAHSPMKRSPQPTDPWLTASDGSKTS